MTTPRSDSPTGSMVARMTDDPPRPSCHCQEHRLAIVIGSEKNGTIQLARDWVFDSKLFQHKVAFGAETTDYAPDMDAPLVPGAHGWSRITGVQRNPDGTPKLTKGKKDTTEHTTPIKKGTLDDLLDTFNECCHWSEVMVLGHGHQAKIWPSLIGTLPKILNQRPLRKLILWICDSPLEFRPDAHRKTFDEVVRIAKPRDCPCGCNMALCVLQNADQLVNRQVHCPTHDDCVTILSAGWHDHTFTDGVDAGNTRQYPSRLSMSDDPKAAQPFSSPDGRLRVMKVCPGGTPANPQLAVTTSMEARATIVGKLTVQSTDESPVSKQSVDEHAQTQPTNVDPGTDPASRYTGPHACADREGCILDPTGTSRPL